MIRFVSTNPGTGSGTILDPFGQDDWPSGNVNSAANCLKDLQPGDELVFRGGAYRLLTADNWALPMFQPPRSGTPEAPIVFRNHDGEQPEFYHEAHLANNGSALFGVTGKSYITFRGLTLYPNRKQDGTVTSSQPGIRILCSGGHNLGILIEYCTGIGDIYPSSDNHDCIHTDTDATYRTQGIIRYCDISGFLSTTPYNINSSGIKLYATSGFKVLDNWIRNCVSGIFSKNRTGQGVADEYARNLIEDCAIVGFQANLSDTADPQSVWDCHDNLILRPGNFPFCYTKGLADCLLRNNVLESGIFESASRAWVKQSGALTDSYDPTINCRMRDNICIGDAATIFGVDVRNQPWDQSPHSFAEIDHNLYVTRSSGLPAPTLTYRWNQYGTPVTTFTLAQIRAADPAFEINSQAIAGGPAAIFNDPSAYDLKTAYLTAGSGGSKPGPANPATILDTTRYGVAALLAGAPVPDSDGTRVGSDLSFGVDQDFL